MVRFREQKTKPWKDEQKKIHWQIVQNYSRYKLSDEKYEALSCSLLPHIPVKVKKNATST